MLVISMGLVDLAVAFAVISLHSHIVGRGCACTAQRAGGRPMVVSKCSILNACSASGDMDLPRARLTSGDNLDLQRFCFTYTLYYIERANTCFHPVSKSSRFQQPE